MEHSFNINSREDAELGQRNVAVEQRNADVELTNVDVEPRNADVVSGEEELDLRTLVIRGSKLARRMDEHPEPEECPEDRDKLLWSPLRSTIGGSLTQSLGAQLRQRQEAENEGQDAATLNRQEPPPLPKKGSTMELRRKLELKRPKVLVFLGPLMPTEAQRNERKDSAMDSDSDF